ncbi:MAG: PAS domain S-box protein [Thaumarchaeota archaeon]|nr:PAS domain S-box protein [Nitrososphaerota archaeon]MCL5318106.1 PAS domain S-box protein [Nitrososphaerota archaeon]
MKRIHKDEKQPDIHGLLLQAANALAESLDLQRTLNTLASITSQLTHCSRVTICLLENQNQDQTKFKLVASRKGYGILPPIGQSYEFNALTPKVRQAVETKKSMVVDYEEPGIARANKERADAIKARLLLVTPIVYNGEVIGFMSLDEPEQRRSFTTKEIRLIEGIASQAAVALNRAKLFEEHKQYDEALLKAKEETELDRKRLETILETIPSAVVILEKTGKIPYINKRAMQLYGLDGDKSSSDVYMKTIKVKTINGEPYPFDRNPAARALSGEVVRNEELIIQKADGALLPILASSAPIYNATGEVVSSIAVFEDISKPKQAEEALRKAHDELELRVRERTAELEKTNEALQQSEEKYRTLIDNIQDGVFIIQDRKVRFVNEVFAGLAGYTVEDVIGKDFWDFVAPEDRDMVVDRYWRRIGGKGTSEAQDVPREYEFNLIHKNGTTRFLVNVNVGVVNYQGKMTTIGTMKNVTEKKLEAQLLRAQRMESIGRLAGGIAHDLNNLLTPTTISLHLLKEKLTDEESKEVLNLLEKNTWRAADLMTKLLTFARGVEVDRKPLQLSQIICEIQKLIRETFPRNIEIRTRVQKDLWTTLGDSTQILQVIMNLCVNARDAMPKGGILTVSAENITINKNCSDVNSEAKPGQYVAITVSDTGTGIPDFVRERMFEPFFTTKDQSKGSGLGLSISLGVVKSHNGFINVFSEVGKGSEFKVHLPAYKATEELKHSKRGRGAEQARPARGQGAVILIVEDEPSVLKVTRMTLENQGYRTITATDGTKAVDAYSQNQDVVNAVLLDMMMPVMDGDTTIKALRKINPSVKIIAVSGFAKKDRYEKSIEDAQAFLMKPYTADELLKTINQVLTAQ